MAKKLREVFLERSLKRKRLRDLGIKVGRLPTGKTNSIVDVPGVKVGHATLIDGTGKRKPGTGPIRTGVTVISPNDDIYHKKLMAGGFILNGAGEMTGMIQLNEWGLIETPIALTNTMSVGQVGSALSQWMVDQYKDIHSGRQVVIPVVGECDDSFLNDSGGLHVKAHHVREAVGNLSSEPPAEGAVGAGTGMICCDFKAGIGSSSRVVKIGSKSFNLGCLVLSNFGDMDELRLDGVPIGKALKKEFSYMKTRRENYGSIITVLATDLPLGPLQLQRLCKRAALGIGRVGSHAAHGSGEIILGFSTANVIPRDEPFYKLQMTNDSHINVAYEAAIEVVEEAIWNSLCMAVEMEGVEGNVAPSIPLERVSEVYNKQRVY
ncbi:P1 family peptidase [bacterium]|nr:P1 family peptidase [bacterium]